MNKVLTTDQISGTADRAGLVIVTWLLTVASQRGWISQGDAITLAPAILVVIGIAWGWWVNRPKAILEAATNTGATVITTPEMAKATPGNEKIVSSIEDAKEVVNK